MYHGRYHSLRERDNSRRQCRELNAIVVAGEDRDPATLTVAYIKARDRWVRSRPDIGRPSGGASLRDHAGFLSASEVSALAAKLGAELTTEELEMAENH